VLSSATISMRLNYIYEHSTSEKQQFVSSVVEIALVYQRVLAGELIWIWGHGHQQRMLPALQTPESCWFSTSRNISMTSSRVTHRSVIGGHHWVRGVAWRLSIGENHR